MTTYEGRFYAECNNTLDVCLYDYMEDVLNPKFAKIPTSQPTATPTTLSPTILPSWSPTLFPSQSPTEQPITVFEKYGYEIEQWDGAPGVNGKIDDWGNIFTEYTQAEEEEDEEWLDMAGINEEWSYSKRADEEWFYSAPVSAQCYMTS